MLKINKILIFCTALAAILAVADFALAQGKGYFLEKNDSFYILDDLYISGFLAVEQNLSAVSGLPGDVLIENQFLLDENNNIYFCEDERVSRVNLPLNKDCAKKLLIWQRDSLMVESGRNQLITSNLAANGLINLHVPAGKEIYTRDPVKINGCFSNLNLCQGGSNNGKVCEIDDPAGCPGGGVCQACSNNGDLQTSHLYYQTLNTLSGDLLTISAQRVIFDQINLGDELNVDNNQYVCWKVDKNSSCYGGANAGGDNSKWDLSFTDDGGTPHSLTGDFSGQSNIKLCCFLQITF